MQYIYLVIDRDFFCEHIFAFTSERKAMAFHYDLVKQYIGNNTRELSAVMGEDVILHTEHLEEQEPETKVAIILLKKKIIK